MTKRYRSMSGLLRSLLYLAAYILPFVAEAGCWQITTASDKLTATDFWQVKDVTEDTASMLGRAGNQQQAVNIQSIQAVHFSTGKNANWYSAHRNEVTAEILRTDGSSVSMTTDMIVYYLAADKRSALPVGEINAIERCDESLLPVSSPAELPDSTEAVYRLSLASGDVLHGRIADPQIIWITSYGRIRVRASDIRSVSGSCGQPGLDTLQTAAGDRIRGMLDNRNIGFVLATGSTISVPVAEVKAISVEGVAAPEEQDCSAP